MELSLESPAMKYGYSNARIRAMKATLLKPALLEEMIRVGNVEAVAELLQKTGYKADLAALASVYTGSRLVDAAASRNFARTVRKVINVAPKSDQKAVRALLVRWDLINIKALLHARRLKKTYDEVRPYLFEVGELTSEDFRAILRADDANLKKELMKTEVGRRMLETPLPGEKKAARGDITQQENAIDAYAYVLMNRALGELGGSDVGDVRRILKREVDAKNIMVIERLKRHDVPRTKIEASLIQGGGLPDATLSRLIEAKDLGAVATLIRKDFPNVEIRGEGKKGLTELEIALEKAIAMQKVILFHKAMLSLKVIIGFLLLKEEEMNNLRKIAKGKEFRMTESEIRNMLVIV